MNMPVKTETINGREVRLVWRSVDGVIVFTATDRQTGITAKRCGKAAAIEALFRNLERAGTKGN